MSPSDPTTINRCPVCCAEVEPYHKNGAWHLRCKHTAWTPEEGAGDGVILNHVVQVEAPAREGAILAWNCYVSQILDCYLEAGARAIERMALMLGLEMGKPTIFDVEKAIQAQLNDRERRRVALARPS